MGPDPIANSGSPNGRFQFRMTVSLGNILQLVALCIMAIGGWTTIQARQDVVERRQHEQQDQIQELAVRAQTSAELNARQAAILDELEKRIARTESRLDREKER